MRVAAGRRTRRVCESVEPRGSSALRRRHVGPAPRAAACCAGVSTATQSASSSRARQLPARVAQPRQSVARSASGESLQEQAVPRPQLDEVRTARQRRAARPRRGQRSRPSLLSALEAEIEAAEASAASAGTVGAAAPAYALPDRMLTRREEHDLLRMVHAAAPQDTAAATAPTAEQRRARRAKRILVTFLTVPLLHSATVIARRSQGLVTAAELVDDGHKGLQRAIDRFDASRGNASSLRTFATAHVRGEMRSCVRNKAVAMGTPRTVQAVRARVRATAARRRKESPERDLSAQEESKAVAEELELPAPLVRAALAPVANSLRWQIDDDLPPQAAMDAGLHEQELPPGMDRRSVMQATIDSVLDTLPERERSILRLRYGLNREGQKVPRAEISKAFGTTTLKITQLEHLAWDKIMTGWRQEFIARRTVDVAALDA